jgi:hypothetical protein
MEQWIKEFKREPIAFFMVESEESNAAVLDFIRDENVGILTIRNYNRGFFKGLFYPSYTKKEHPEIQIPILAIHIG